MINSSNALKQLCQRSYRIHYKTKIVFTNNVEIIKLLTIPPRALGVSASFRQKKAPKGACSKSFIEYCKFTRGVEGIRTPDEGFADPCLTTWPRRHFYRSSCS